ncbi:hypothetical protein [Croceicoccus gelatinilyticus]|uniref:hypothetical protein n=1 Tax=Croceicoccus gelatinilyticus TaxID=2835536 RepID=UPI001BD01564|nr:hypothetical protein [Croceicoccus gelatinilyticus]MBS7671536.1 hypothetical protein [Croceicoccus gelatinilyticus]
MTDAINHDAINQDAHALALQAAYGVSNSASDQDVATLFWAMDRFYYDKAETEDGRIQRFQATQRIALELDARKVPMRNPAAPSTYKPVPARPAAQAVAA